MKRLIAFPIAIIAAIFYSVFWLLCAAHEFFAFLAYELAEVAGTVFGWCIEQFSRDIHE